MASLLQKLLQSFVEHGDVRWQSFFRQTSHHTTRNTARVVRQRRQAPFAEHQLHLPSTEPRQILPSHRTLIKPGNLLFHTFSVVSDCRGIAVIMAGKPPDGESNSRRQTSYTQGLGGKFSFANCFNTRSGISGSLVFLRSNSRFERASA